MTIYCADNAAVLPLLHNVDMVFTSPPYNLSTSPGGGFARRDPCSAEVHGVAGKWTGGSLAVGYEDHDDAMPMPEYEDWQRKVVAMCWDALSETGAIFYNHKPRPWKGEVWLPTRLNPDLPLRQIITWVRAGGFNFAPTHYVPTYEWIMVLAKKEWRLRSQGASGVGDVWQVPQDSNTDHPAPFPVSLPARAIESAAPKLVLDPFMGSGTTLVAAKAAGVEAIGIEKSELYCDLAIKRLAQGALFG